MKKNITFVTGTRADFGLLKWLMLEVKKTTNFNLQVIATGTHFLEEFGETYREILNAGFEIDYQIHLTLNDDTAYGTVKSIADLVSSFSDAFITLKPDLLVVLGDRYEILGAVTAALPFKLPIAHLHGGEITEGAFDDSIRHAISKMSHLHFVATDEYRNRVIQLGEQPGNIFNVGGFGLDAINRTTLFSKKEIENIIEAPLLEKNLLVTYHPVTLDSEESQKKEIKNLMSVLSTLEDTRILLTMPNADPGTSQIAASIVEFVQNNPNAILFPSFGQKLYYSVMSMVDGLVGNSSSGILEAPSFNKGTVNIGRRQNGRLQSTSIINCDGTKQSISKALDKLYSSEFQYTLKTSKNPYGAPGAAEKTVKVLEQVNFEGLTSKKFYDL